MLGVKVTMDAMMRLTLITIVLTCMSLSAFAQRPQVKTHYDDDIDAYVTQGVIKVGVPLDDLATMAAAFKTYRQWALLGINRNASGTPYMTILNRVTYHPDRPFGKGHFAILFDVDLIWPFGSDDNVVIFGITHATPRENGPGIGRLAVTLHGDNSLLKRFEIDLTATGDEKDSQVNFRGVVKLNSLVDAFFSLEGYRKNIEYRIIKVLKNLRATIVKRRAREKAAREKAEKAEKAKAAAAAATQVKEAPGAVEMPAPTTVESPPVGR
jgi:hypothetical protein